MALWAWWDPKTGNVIRIENDEPDSRGGAQSGYTGAARSNAALVRYPLVVEYPETYVPRFAGLLGGSLMTLEDGVVYQRFPYADFSEAAVRRSLIDQINHAAKHALGDTDWHFTRRLELGTEIPDEVLAYRQRIREHVDGMKQAVADASPSELLDFDATIRFEDRAWVP